MNTTLRTARGWEARLVIGESITNRERYKKGGLPTVWGSGVHLVTPALQSPSVGDLGSAG